jgi:hypothetical protein
MRVLSRTTSLGAVLLTIIGAAVFGSAPPVDAAVFATALPNTAIYSHASDPRAGMPRLLATSTNLEVSAANMYCYLHGVRYVNRYGFWADMWVRADIDSYGWWEYRPAEPAPRNWAWHGERHISYREWVPRDDIANPQAYTLPVCP